MNIRTTTDPITLRDVSDIEDHPCIYEGDGENGIEIYFENDQTRSDYVSLEPHDPKVLMGNDSDDYVAEG
ncbi:MAG: hypothetical protein PVF82_03100 [Gammaproteobacteria bacterium]|jgi:hypothetical protein